MGKEKGRHPAQHGGSRRTPEPPPGKGNFRNTECFRKARKIKGRGKFAGSALYKREEESCLNAVRVKDPFREE